MREPGNEATVNLAYGQGGLKLEINIPPQQKVRGGGAYNRKVLSEYSNQFCVMGSHTINGLFSEKPINTISIYSNKRRFCGFHRKAQFQYTVIKI